MPHTNSLETSLAALVVIDVQEKMLPAITTSPPSQVAANIARLVEMARLMDLPVLYTEQYPQGLGATVEALKPVLAEARGPIVKTTCSCWRDAGFRESLQATLREHVIVAGVEAHICIQQTVLDLLRVDYVPFVAVDAIGSRRQVDFDVALGRMGRAGAEMCTTESLIFELVERCDHPKFREVLKLIKQGG